VKIRWRGALGIAISVAMLVYVFRPIDWADVAQHIRAANLWLLLLGAVAATGMYPLRAIRWRVILDPVAPRLPLGPLWRAIAIGQMANNTLPSGRVGEIGRPYVLSRERPDVPFSTALASLVVDRVFDAILVFVLLAAALLAPDFPRGHDVLGVSAARYAAGFAVVPIVGLVALYALVFAPNTAIRLFELVARRVSPALEARGRDALTRFASGLSVLRTPRHFLAVFGWTLAHWLLQPFAFWLGLRAFGITVSWSALLFLQAVIVAGVSIPSSPGFFGTFELAAQIALGFYGVSKETAVTWAIAFHVVAFIPITVFGGYYLARLGIKLSDLGSASRVGEAPAG
jgi:uncharacterized protein (TIRG00374 family)